MTRSKRIQPIADDASRREQDAARELGGSRQNLAQVQQRLAEMHEYRQDYLQRFQTSGSHGIGAGQMKEFRNFLAKVDTAIGQLEASLGLAETNVERKRQAWLATRTRSKAIDGVVSRYQSEEQRHADRLEQKDTDERAQRAKGLEY